MEIGELREALVQVMDLSGDFSLHESKETLLHVGDTYFRVAAVGTEFQNGRSVFVILAGAPDPQSGSDVWWAEHGGRPKQGAFKRPDSVKATEWDERLKPGERRDGPEHIVTAIPLGNQVYYGIEHPADCDALPYGQKCWLDHLEQSPVTGWPLVYGRYRMRPWASMSRTAEGDGYDGGVDYEPIAGATGGESS